ncbi:unnamed protein product [Arabidopsis halleri]
MEEERRNDEESSHLCIPLQFLNEALKTFLKCIGLHLSSSASSEEATHDVVSATKELIGFLAVANIRYGWR